MGAYTFEKQPPFRITKISKYPIVCKETKNKKIVFPCGFVVDHKEDRDRIHLSYGENDNKAKIMSLDKQTLMQSMKEVKPYAR